jgi:hypothetical protein
MCAFGGIGKKLGKKPLQGEKVRRKKLYSRVKFFSNSIT